MFLQDLGRVGHLCTQGVLVNDRAILSLEDRRRDPSRFPKVNIHYRNILLSRSRFQHKPSAKVDTTDFGRGKIEAQTSFQHGASMGPVSSLSRKQGEKALTQ